ncbi:hypothetical protein Q3G72_013159 [Acer saccharum]|nr:hypothetical protein Q3G72_013159 [Acer saccharum]
MMLNLLVTGRPGSNFRPPVDFGVRLSRQPIELSRQLVGQLVGLLIEMAGQALKFVGLSRRLVKTIKTTRWVFEMGAFEIVNRAFEIVIQAIETLVRDG